MLEDRKVYLVHAMPGRIRVRLDRSIRSPEVMRSLAETISQVEGVRQVQANPATGSVLVLYDPGVLSLESLQLAAAAANVSVALPDTAPGPVSTGQPSPVAQGIFSVFGRFDGAISNLTGGKMDAGTLVPLGLGAVGLRRLMAGGANLGTIPWYILLWYSFEVFTKYALRRAQGPEENAGQVQR